MDGLGEELCKRGVFSLGGLRDAGEPDNVIDLKPEAAGRGRMIFDFGVPGAGHSIVGEPAEGIELPAKGGDEGRD
jgi:hypothetical protein